MITNRNISYKDINGICRFCLESNLVLKPLFDNKQCVDFSQTKYDNTREFIISAGLETNETGIYPKYVCNLCYDKLLMCRTFQMQCKISANILNKIIWDHNNSKKEFNRQSLQPNGFNSDIGLKEPLKVSINDTHRKSTNTKILKATKSKKIPRVLPPNAAGERKFECDFCGKQFSKISNLKIHFNIHTGKRPYKCDKCVNKFRALSTLRSHKLSHSNERQYVCEICGKKYRYSHGLTQHRRVHTQDRRYPCQFCNTRFLTSGALKMHIPLHTGERKYRCEYCSKGFIKKFNLTLHQRVHKVDLSIT